MSWDLEDYTKIGQSDSGWLFSKIQQDSGMAEAGGQGGRTPPPPPIFWHNRRRRITTCPLRFSDRAPSLSF